MSETLDQTEEERVLERVVRNQLLIKELTEENDTLKAFFKERTEAYPVGLSKEVGKFYIKVSRNARVDDKLARATLGANVYSTLVKQVIDGPTAKRLLSEEEYESIQKVYDPKVEVGMV